MDLTAQQVISWLEKAKGRALEPMSDGRLQPDRDLVFALGRVRMLNDLIANMREKERSYNAGDEETGIETD